MERIKSIDIFRGVCILNFMMVHYLVSWLPYNQLWAFDAYWAYFDMMGACAFLFISGIGIMLYYKNKMVKVEDSIEPFNKATLRHEYLLRGIFVLVISLIYNIAQSLFFSDATWLWRWDVLQAIAVSILLAWPLLKLSKNSRIVLGVLFMVLNYFIYDFLLSHDGQVSVLGTVYYILYNEKNMAENPFLPAFSIFLIGTVIGELFFEFSKMENDSERKRSIKINMLLKSIVVGVVLITFGVLFNYPDFINNRSFSWWIYVLGFDIIIISLLYSVEKLLFADYTKRHRFLYYFSYYSLTIFIFHALLGFAFFQLLSISDTFWVVYITTVILFGVISKFAHDRWGWKASIKNIIGKASSFIAIKIDQKFLIPRLKVAPIAPIGLKK